MPTSETHNPIVSPELTLLADKVFALVSRGNAHAAEKLLIENGFRDAHQQVADITGFIAYRRSPISMRW